MAVSSLPNSDRILELLTRAKNIAVVGLSDSPLRPSFGVSAYMQAQGYKIIPVNPLISESLGEKSYKSLLDIPEKVDIVNVFRRSEHIPALLEQLLEVHPRLVWLQQGIRHDEVARQLEAAGIPVVMDRCLAVDHQFLGA